MNPWATASFAEVSSTRTATKRVDDSNPSSPTSASSSATKESAVKERSNRSESTPNTNHLKPPPISPSDTTPPPTLSDQQSLLSTLATRATQIPTSTHKPLQFLDHVSILHNTIFRPPRAIIYDRLILLTLLLHTSHILLLVHQPKSGPRGYKPPCKVFHATNLGTPTYDTTTASQPLDSIFIANITSTLRLTPDQIIQKKTPPLHDPRFGTRRFYNTDTTDAWIITRIYEFVPRTILPGTPLNDVEAGRRNHLPTRVSPIFLHTWTPNTIKVEYMKWFDEDMCETSRELDEVTREILLRAFEVTREERRKKRLRGLE